jgi:hypothetical protein
MCARRRLKAEDGTAAVLDGYFSAQLGGGGGMAQNGHLKLQFNRHSELNSHTVRMLEVILVYPAE